MKKIEIIVFNANDYDYMHPVATLKDWEEYETFMASRCELDYVHMLVEDETPTVSRSKRVKV